MIKKLTKCFSSKTLLCGIAVFAVSFAAISAHAAVRYVKENGAGTKDGSMWTNASDDLQEMINASEANDEIWVAAGTYKPAHIAGNGVYSQHRAFVLKADVKIYGSFSGTETALGQRQLPVSGNYDYTSILSGDFDGNDSNDALSRFENAFHVVISAGNIGVALLDGFTIIGGNANGGGSITVNSESINSGVGGGIFTSASSPTLTNLNISRNTANSGAGIGSYGGSPVLSNVILYGNNGNVASSTSGGIWNNGASPILTNVIISANAVNNNGGRMWNYNNSSPVLNNVTISENTAGNNGGGVFNDGGATPAFNNVIIRNNMAGNDGGGMFNSIYSSSTLTNVTIRKNEVSNLAYKKNK